MRRELPSDYNVKRDRNALILVAGRVSDIGLDGIAKAGDRASEGENSLIGYRSTAVKVAWAEVRYYYNVKMP